MTRSEIIKFLILRSIGNFLVLFAVFGVFVTFGPAVYYETQFRITQFRGIQYKVAEDSLVLEESRPSPFGEILKRQKAETLASKTGGFAGVLTGPKEQILIPKDTNFSILILKIGANAKVWPNVDPINEKEFLPYLQTGVAHARGTVFPGMSGNIYLFAHSADNFWNAGRYNAVFYLLKDLTLGDDVIIFFEKKRYNYKVTKSEILEASDVSALTKSSSDSETLILQTCWPPGTTWKRLLVFAKPR